MSGEDPQFRRVVDGLELAIDPDLCVGFGDCVEEDPLAFRLNDEGIAVLVDPGGSTPERLAAAARACPVDAITLREASGRILAP